MKNEEKWLVMQRWAEDDKPTLATRVEVTEAHWAATKTWIESGWTDQDAHDEMEYLRNVIVRWSK